MLLSEIVETKKKKKRTEREHLHALVPREVERDCPRPRQHVERAVRGVEDECAAGLEGPRASAARGARGALRRGGVGGGRGGGGGGCGSGVSAVVAAALAAAALFLLFFRRGGGQGGRGSPGDGGHAGRGGGPRGRGGGRGRNHRAVLFFLSGKKTKIFFLRSRGGDMEKTDDEGRVSFFDSIRSFLFFLLLMTARRDRGRISSEDARREPPHEREEQRERSREGRAFVFSSDDDVQTSFASFFPSLSWARKRNKRPKACSSTHETWSKATAVEKRVALLPRRPSPGQDEEA